MRIREWGRFLVCREAYYVRLWGFACSGSQIPNPPSRYRRVSTSIVIRYRVLSDRFAALAMARPIQWVTSPGGSARGFLVALMMSLTGCADDKIPVDSDNLDQSQIASRNVRENANVPVAVEQLLSAGLNESNSALQGMRRLNGDEISRLIVGRTLVEDRRGLQGMPYPQGERFLSGGVVAVQLDRIGTRGSYWIRANALCVATSVPAASSCRALYRSRDGRLIQAFYGLGGRITPILIV